MTGGDDDVDVDGRRRGKRVEAELPVSKHHIQPECGERAGWRWTGRPNPYRENKLSEARTGTWSNYFPCSANHEKDWEPCPVDPYSAIIRDDHLRIPNNILCHQIMHCLHYRRASKGIRFSSPRRRGSTMNYCSTICTSPWEAREDSS